MTDTYYCCTNSMCDSSHMQWVLRKETTPENRSLENCPECGRTLEMVI